jgi:hypothetical protein
MLRAGIESDGVNVSIPHGTISARNFIGAYSNVLYVDKSVTTSGSGRSWANAYKTITEAVAAATTYDIIAVGPGFYTEVATQALTTSHVGLKIIGCNSTGKTRGPCAMKSPSGDTTTPIISMTANCNDVEICNIGFIATGAGKAIQLGTASSGYVWRTHIHDCGFFGDGVGTYAIGNYDITTTPSAGAFPDVAETVVENCWFYAWTTAAIATYGTRCLNRNNTIFVPAGANGIIAGCGRPFLEISGNKILGVNSTDTGVVITGNDDGSLVMVNNYLLCLNLAHTKAISDAGITCNYSWNNSTTITQHDPDT